MEKRNQIGFLYVIQYIGSNDKIKGLKYAGSKLLKSKHKWENYYGSPSKKNCKKCKQWKLESKRNPNDFKKEIIEYVYEGESITEKERLFLMKICDNISKNENWLNSALPNIKGFPECEFTEKERKRIFEKRKNTNKIKYGNIYGNFTNIEKRKDTTLKRYGVDHINKLESYKLKNSAHKKTYFSEMTHEQRKLHGKKIKEGHTKEGIRLGVQKTKETKSKFTESKKKSIENKRFDEWKRSVSKRSTERQKELNKIYSESSYWFNKFRYITLKFIETGEIISKFSGDWIKEGFCICPIEDRIKNNSKKIIKSRKGKGSYIVMDCVFLTRDEVFRNQK